MRILQVVNVRWFNAAADYAVRLSAGLAGRGHQVRLIVLPGKRPEAEAQAAGLETTPLPELNSVSPAALAASWRKLSGLLAAESYDLINAHFGEGYPLIAAAARRFSPGAAVVRTRGDQRPPRRAPLTGLILGRWTDGLIAANELIRSWLTERLKLPDPKIAVIYYGTDIERFRPGLPPPVETTTLIPAGAPVVGYLGRLDAVKGEAHFMPLLRLLAGADPRIRFLLAVRRDSVQPERLKEGLRRAGLADRTVLLGQVDDPARILSAFHVGFVSSIGSEMNARVLQEMMACGLPVVAAKVGVIPEILADGRSGVLVPPGDPAAMAHEILRLLKDEPGRLRMGACARERVAAGYSLDAMVLKTEDFYRRILEKKKGTA